jgi:hypothetical protein
MEVHYDQEPFARPRYGYIVTEVRHEEQQGEIKRASHLHGGTWLLGTCRHALPSAFPKRREMPIAADRG